MASAEDVAADSDSEPLKDVPSISLVDHTKPTEPVPSHQQQEQHHELSRAPSSLKQTLTHGSIRQTLARRKYQKSKWQEGGGSQSAVPQIASPTSPSVSGEVAEGKHDEPSTSSPTRPSHSRNTTLTSSLDGIGQSQDQVDTWGQGRARRTGRKVKDAVLGREQTTKAHSADPDSHIDILVENQRGFFFAGIPRFSSNSLLNFDPPAWLDGRFRPSAVNITNAQVPDPSWEWVWRCWYVDMSGDVDEEGWEYSFGFGKRTAWHGTHPWFHSFVRRRRWLRKRTRRKRTRAKIEAHALTSDYFTIHSKLAHNGGEEAQSMTTSENKGQHPMQASSAWGAESWKEKSELLEIENVPDLLRGLRTAAVDREKIILVKKFLESGREELHYLAGEMEHIMKILVFQNSRRQLLSILMHEFDAAEKRRDEHKKKGEEESDDERRHLDNLLKAVQAADEQCKQLEYWSDVKEMARDGDILKASDHDHGWHDGWQGLDASAPSPPGSGFNSSEEVESSEKPDKGKQPVRGLDEMEKSNAWMDGTSSIRLPAEFNLSKPSAESGRLDTLHSPFEENSETRAVNSAKSSGGDGTTDERRESEVSYDTYGSARSELKDEQDADDLATERAPSEDERDYDDTPPREKSPPVGATPVEAFTKPVEAIQDAMTGRNEGEEDKGTPSPPKYADFEKL